MDTELVFASVHHILKSVLISELFYVWNLRQRMQNRIWDTVSPAEGHATKMTELSGGGNIHWHVRS